MRAQNKQQVRADRISRGVLVDGAPAGRATRFIIYSSGRHIRAALGLGLAASRSSRSGAGAPNKGAIPAGVEISKRVNESEREGETGADNPLNSLHMAAITHLSGAGQSGSSQSRRQQPASRSSSFDASSARNGDEQHGGGGGGNNNSHRKRRAGRMGTTPALRKGSAIVAQVSSCFSLTALDEPKYHLERARSHREQKEAAATAAGESEPHKDD
jgi:hypothetical protein